MLYAYASLTGKFDDACLVGGRRIEEWFHGAEWRYCVSRVDDCKYGGSNGRWPNSSAPYRQGASTKTIFALQELDDLGDEPSGKWDLVAKPSFDARVDL